MIILNLTNNYNIIVPETKICIADTDKGWLLLENVINNRAVINLIGIIALLLFLYLFMTYIIPNVFKLSVNKILILYFLSFFLLTFILLLVSFLLFLTKYINYTILIILVNIVIIPFLLDLADLIKRFGWFK